MTGICTSSALALLARLNKMEANMPVDTQHAQDALGTADVAGPQPVDITQPVCQQNAIKTGSDLDFIMGFEDGSIFSQDDIVAGFQQLINSGLVWKLQGSYGRMAQYLIDLGFCHLPTASD